MDSGVFIYILFYNPIIFIWLLKFFQPWPLEALSFKSWDHLIPSRHWGLFLFVCLFEHSYFLLLKNTLTSNCVLLAPLLESATFPNSPGFFYWRWDSPGKNTGVGCHAFLQSIFPTQDLNPGIEGRFFTVWATREAHWRIPTRNQNLVAKDIQC